MKLCSSRFRGAVWFLILLGLSSYMSTKLCFWTQQIEHNATLEAIELRNITFSKIEGIAKLWIPLNSSASNLARSLSSYLNGTDLSFPSIQTKVAPTLFLALSTIPHVSQVSYVGLDGLLFSFYNDGDDTLAVFSNTSYSSTWYTQPVNRDTGKLYGEAISSNFTVAANSSWFQEALNSTMAYSSLGTSWNTDQDLLFLSTAAMYGRGVISLGFPAQIVIDHFTDIDLNGGDLFLASNDGQVLVQTKLERTHIDVYNGTVSVQLIKLTGEVEDNVIGNHSCRANDGDLGPSILNVRGMKHTFYCSILEIAGVQSVYTLAFPFSGLESLVHQKSNLELTIVGLMFVIILASLCVSLVLTLRSARREMYLCAALVKQMESIQQAERKSMNKSLAFARASHDVRTPLQAIQGLIQHCHGQAPPNTDLAVNLAQMDTHTMDLVAILDSVLDTSKIEAGKMQLEEAEFNVAQLLEDVVDMYYRNAIEKGVDVVLDPCDGSILKIHSVKGDRGKLKQILCNLLSNAVKFTSEGHVSVRATVKKISKQNAIIASNRNGLLNCLSALCDKKNDSFSSSDDLQTVQQNPNRMEFVFEVDDTGKGIPKDKQMSVFENFVQIKETAHRQEGCGLGLGIVQSLVRLMGGEIKIVDKEPSERGTRFRFNIFLAACDTVCTETGEHELKDIHSSEFHQPFGPLVVRSPARSGGSHVVLLLAGEERRRITKKWIEGLGIKVSAVKHVKDLFNVLERIKQKLDLCQFSSSGKNERSLLEYLHKSASGNSDSGGNDGSSGTKEGNDHVVPPCKKSNSKGSSNFVLIVVDAGVGPFSELCSLVADFRQDVQNSLCKIVWIDNVGTSNTKSRAEEDNGPSPPCDHVLSKPLHGSRLHRVLGLLPEFGATYQCNSPKLITETSQGMQYSVGTNVLQQEISSPHQKPQLSERVIYEAQSNEKPLSGKKVLVVDDVPLLRTLVANSLSKLGASVEGCENGKEAFDQVCKSLSDQKKEGHSTSLPYNYIFMDCEMPVMNGYEATRLIRMEEKCYGVHIPIIALTAHAMAEEKSKTIECGMDFHLTKPLQIGQLLDIIMSLRV